MPSNGPSSTPGTFDEAVGWFRARVPMRKDEWLKLNDEARRKASTIAGVAQVDIIGDVMKELEKSLTKGETLEDFRARVKDKLSKAWGGEEIPGRIECLPGDNLVSGAVVRAGHRRWFQGDVMEVVTEGGRDFTATPNHPMLTTCGWQGAGQLRPGHYLVSYDGQQDARARGNTNKADSPTSIAQVYESTAQTAWRQRMATGQFDFHGDAINGQVDVVRPFNELSFGTFAPLTQPLEKLVFPEANLMAGAPFRFCRACQHLVVWSQRCGFCDVPTPDAHSLQAQFYDAVADAEAMRYGTGAFARKVASGDVWQGQPTVLHGWGAAPGEVFQPGITEAPRRLGVAHDIGDPSRRYANAPPNVSQAQAVAIKPDRVIRVRRKSFEGHVFNLSTPFGYFYLNGLVTGNTIFRTNVQHAYSQGRRAQMTTPSMLKIRPYFRFAALLDMRTTEVCRRADGIILPASDPFWSKCWPPNHFNCRSTIISMRASVAEEEGVSDDAPDVEAQEGFGTADPLEWKPDLKKYPPDLAKAAAKKEKLQAPPKAPKQAPEKAPEEPAPPFAGPDGARYAKEFPKLAKTYGARLFVKESEHARAQLAELEALPEAVLSQVAKSGTRVFIAPGHLGDMRAFHYDIDQTAEAMDKRPRKAEGTGGVYVPGRQGRPGFLAIGTHQYVGEGANREKQDVQTLGVARHEFGHAFDFTSATPLSQDLQFRTAWRNMQLTNIGRVNPYFLQDDGHDNSTINWTRGAIETFAESFKLYYDAGGSEKGRAAVEKVFTKDIADRFHQLMKDVK